MKKILVGLLALGSISVFAADVCRVSSGPTSSHICTAKTICTDQSASNNQTEHFDDVIESIESCTRAELKAIKLLIEHGYKLETKETLIKH